MILNQIPRTTRHGSGEASGDEHHVMPVRGYLLVFASLLILTVVTVGVSLLGLPPVPSLIVAILVATVKAAIVALWFMHLISEKFFYSFILLSTLFFMGLFFVFTLVDLSSRGATNIEETPQYWRQFSHERPATK